MLSFFTKAVSPRGWAWLRARDFAFQVVAKSNRAVYRVHQFRSGPPTSAVSAAMVNLQQVLWGLGYQSEIFEERSDLSRPHRHSRIGPRQLRGDYVLIVHRSRRDDVNGWIVALPAKIVFMLHEISPLEFLATIPDATGQWSFVRAPLRRGRAATIGAFAGDDHAAVCNNDRSSRAEGAALDTIHHAKPLRIAWISTWDVRCGIAGYSKSLLQPLIEQPDNSLLELVVLSDDRTPPSRAGERVKILPCWNGVEPAMDRVGRAVSSTIAEFVVIQHQPGLIKWSGLVELLNDPRIRGRKTVVALHAARRLLDLESAERTAVVNSLRGASKVLVHRTGDVDLLSRLGVASNVMLFPLGADQQFCVPLPRSLTEHDKIVIGCYGFFLPGKGIDRLIEAFAVLKRTWPRLWLQLTNADYSAASRGEIARCRNLANKLGVSRAIEWDLVFHTRDESMLKLAQCDLIVLPYDENKESASAALHTAMASGVPMAVTPVSVFDEAEEAVFRFDRLDSRSIAKGIDDLLRNQELRQRLQFNASRWLVERNWAVVSLRLQDMLTGLSA